MNWPKPMSGLTNPLTTWLNRLLACARGCEILESKEIRVEHTSHGIYLHPKLLPGGAGAGPSAQISLFAIATVSGADYVSAQQVIATNTILGPGTILFQLGPAINVAKWFQHRPSNYLTVPDIFDGVTVSYTGPPAIVGADAAYNDNNRVATINTNGQNQIENQVLFPRYTTIAMTGAQHDPSGVNFYSVNSIHQALIAAVKVGPTNLSGVFVNGSELTWLEIPRRVWAKRYNQ